ncbi:MAG: DUF6285 domain-containing protein [Candidatus Binatia bacterium]|nr:DUF6285 domain-containing protein [Candidatus Binatia bacterium]
MHDRPNVHELLDVVQTFLDEEIVPATKGRKQFLARVAANCVRMVDRELGVERKQFERAWSGLNELFGVESAPTDRVERSLAVTGRLDLLCERIQDGDLDEDSEHWDRTLAFVRDRVRDKLEVSNPKLLATDAKRGIE